MAISAYAPDTGRVRIVKDLDLDVFDRDVVLVEDIVDTGLTLTYLLGELRAGAGPGRSRRAPCSTSRSAASSPRPCASAASRSATSSSSGYGLDFAGRYRNLDRVVAGDLSVLRADPDAYVGALYAR